ncbi:MAG: hypothetical protein RL376_25, partial [Verrucomicrobiota bacterium]
MKVTEFTSVWLCFLGFLPSLVGAHVTDALAEVIPAVQRLPEKPAWEQDVTEALSLASGKAYVDVMSREARVSRVRGDRLRWSLPVTLPPQAEAGWPVVLEADES